MKKSSAAHKILVKKYYLATGLSSAHFILPIGLLYGATQLGFSFTQTASIFTVQLPSSVFFDFVGGSLADRFSKKCSFAYGSIILALSGVIPYIFISTFISYIPLAIIAGFGTALMSGSLDGIIANNVMTSDQSFYKKANSGAQSALFISRALSSVIGGLLYFAHPTLPYYLYSLALFLAALTAFSMRDDSKNSDSEASRPLNEVMRFAINSFRRHPLTLLVPIVAMSVATVGMDSLFGYYQPYFSANGVAEYYLGYIYAAISIIGAIGALLGRKIKKDHFSILIILTLTILQGFIFAFLNWKIALGSVILLAFASGLYNPVLRLIINAHSEYNYRTSALSVGSSLSTLGAITGLQIAAIVADHGNNLTLGLIVVATQIIAAIFFIPYYRAVRT